MSWRDEHEEAVCDSMLAEIDVLRAQLAEVTRERDTLRTDYAIAHDRYDELVRAHDRNVLVYRGVATQRDEARAERDALAAIAVCAALDSRAELTAARNDAATNKEFYDTVCKHVMAACVVLGIDPAEIPADTWALHERCVEVMRQLAAANKRADDAIAARGDASRRLGAALNEHAETVYALEAERDAERTAHAETRARLEAVEQDVLHGANELAEAIGIVMVDGSSYVKASEQVKQVIDTERAARVKVEADAAAMRDWCAAWLIRARETYCYREGWEAEGLTASECGEALTDVLANLGCDAGTENPDQVREAKRLLAMKPKHSPPSGRLLLDACKAAREALTDDEQISHTSAADDRKERALALLAKAGIQ